MVQPRGTSSADAGPIEAPRAPAAAPAPPVRRRGGNWRKWRARFIVLLLLAGAVLAFIKISDNRAAASHRITLEDVTLTAQAIPVETPRTGQVLSVLVAAQQQVTAGQRVGTMEVIGIDAKGDPKVTKVNLIAPRNGIVIDTPAPVGSTVQPGQPFLQLYDPAELTFVTEVPVEDLPVIAPTMTAALRMEGVDRTVHARVQRIVPRVQGAATTSGDDPGALQVVLTPATVADAQGLVPGLRFTGYVDTTSGRPGSGRLVSMPRTERDGS